MKDIDEINVGGSRIEKPAEVAKYLNFTFLSVGAELDYIIPLTKN